MIDPTATVPAAVPPVPPTPPVTPPIPPVTPPIPPAPPTPPVEAPVPETPVIKPHKKFPVKAAGVAALALFILGGGIFGYNLMQQQNKVESLAGACSARPCGAGSQCAGDTDGDGEGECVPRGTTDEQIESGDVEPYDPPENPWGGDGGDPTDGNNCDFRCQGTDARGQSYDFCIDRTSPIGCLAAAAEEGYQMSNCTGTVNGNNFVTFHCASDEADGNCLDNENVLPPGVSFDPSTQSIRGEFCGVIQVDENIAGGHHCSFIGRNSNSGECNTNEPPGDNPPGSPNPSPSPSPSASLVCSYISSDTAAPKIGDDVTFTCVGSTTPAGITALTYEYRYAINSGAWQTMSTNGATPAKGLLTIETTGSYAVQCRACGNLSNQTVCSPDWATATP